MRGAALFRAIYDFVFIDFLGKILCSHAENVQFRSHERGPAIDSPPDCHAPCEFQQQTFFTKSGKGKVVAGHNRMTHCHHLHRVMNGIATLVEGKHIDLHDV